jgi:serine/threonine-protein kinase RsbW
MQISLALLLPRDELTVPVARHICRHALEDLGVADECRGDIEVALTEACANVLKHSGGEEEYEITVSVEDDICVIRVIDKGRGFDASAALDPAADDDESGRGIALMKALVDRVKLESKPEDGTIVHLEKRLEFEEASVVKKLT